MNDVPNTYYRGTIKAVIHDNNGAILVVKESSDFIDLPGGGIDHGETLQQAMTRELAEEIGYDGTFMMDLVGAEVLERRNGNGHVLFIVYNVTLQTPYSPTNGTDATEVFFVDPHQYKGETDRSLQMIYKYGAGDTSATVDYRVA